MSKYVAETMTELDVLAEKCRENGVIDSNLYQVYDVKRGLRDINGLGVMAGLTKISEIKSSELVNGERIPCEGVLRYRGIDVRELCRGFSEGGRFGFEETTYLLLFGKLPNAEELEEFQTLLARSRTLPTNFVRDVIMKAPSKDMMNTLARSVLTLACYDKRIDDHSMENILRQCIMLISVFPMLAVYGYQAYNHYSRGQSLYIHRPSAKLSTAENLLRMLRPNKQYTELEAKILDVALVLHAEHGGGNNSTFTTHVVTSSGADTYAVVAAALGSLKGPKHGGANIKVVQMFQNLKETVEDWNDETQVEDYLVRLLHKEAFDRKGLIYGMGHAVYSVSDPRAEIFKGYVEQLAHEKGRDEDYRLYAAVAKLAPQVIARERRIYKGVSANVDFYSGFVYSMLDLPQELFTPIFAIARISGWSAHRMEELINQDKIIRPAYQCVMPKTAYQDLENR